MSTRSGGSRDTGGAPAHGSGHGPLRGVRVCCSSYSASTKAELEAALVGLGATFDNQLLAAVSVLVCDSTDTDKYRTVAAMNLAAYKAGARLCAPHWEKRRQEQGSDPRLVPIVKASWVRACAAARAAVPVSEHRLLPFTDLVVTVTGFATVDGGAAIKDRIEALVTGNGGVWSGPMQRSTTHLVAQSPSGPKYEAAMRWEPAPFVVNRAWIETSVATMSCLDEHTFGVEHPRAPAVTTPREADTPTTVAVSRSMSAPPSASTVGTTPATPRVGAGGSPPKEPSATSRSAAAAPHGTGKSKGKDQGSEAAKAGAPTGEDAQDSTAVARKRAAAAAISTTRRGRGDKREASAGTSTREAAVAEPRRRRRSPSNGAGTGGGNGPSSDPWSAAVFEPRMVRDAYGNAAAAEDDDGGDDARASAPTPSLSEASRSALSLQLAAATSKCGWYLSSCVAYVACDGERRAELCRLLRAGGATRMDTLRNGVTHVLLGPHGLPPREAEVVRAIEPAPVLCRRQWLLECTRARAHLPAPRNLTLSAVTTVGAPHRGAGAGSSGNTDGRASRSGRDSKRESKRAKVSGPFEGLRFAALTAGLPDHSKALQRIAELGGEVMLECAPGEADESVVEQLRKMHYVLCPEALPGLRKLLAGRRIPVVTMPWVQACRRAKRVVDSTESVSYEPLPFAVPLPAMQGTVEGAGAGAGAGSGSSEGGDGVRVCVTQYAGAVRREIMYVARLLGAQYLPDCDARCTHLVAMRPDALTDDTKFGYAVARGIPVVRCEWLWEAARTGTVPDTAEFAVRPTRAGQAAGDTPMPASTEGHSDSRGGGSEAEQRAEAEAEAEAEEDEEEAELVDPAIVELQKQARKARRRGGQRVPSVLAPPPSSTRVVASRSREAASAKAAAGASGAGTPSSSAVHMAGRDVAAAGAEGGDEAGGKGTLDSTFQSQEILYDAM